MILTATESKIQYPSLWLSALITGLILVWLAYALAVPLGSAMWLVSNTWIVIASQQGLWPSFALFQQLPWFTSFDWWSSILPFQIHSLSWAGERRYLTFYQVILGDCWAPVTAIWIRDVMIDLRNHDFVRFAIVQKVCLKKKFQTNTSLKMPVPLCSGIPGATLLGLSVVQPLLKQSSPSQVGKMLIYSVKANLITLWSLVLSSSLHISIFSRLLGDIWMTIIDTRILLTERGGK